MNRVILATSYPGGILAIIFAIGWLVACLFSVGGIIATVAVLIRKQSGHLVSAFSSFTTVSAFISLLSIVLKLVSEASDKEVMKDRVLYDEIVNETVPLISGSVVLTAIGVVLWRVSRRKNEPASAPK